MNSLFVANFLKNLPTKAQLVILKKAVTAQTIITVIEELIKLSCVTNLEIRVIAAITPLGFINWKKYVSKNFTGFSAEDLDLSFEKEIL